MIKKTIPEIQFQAGTGGFKIPKGYRFVRSLSNQFASEYYLIPFHWPMRLYWRMFDLFIHKLRMIIIKMHARGWWTQKEEDMGKIMTWLIDTVPLCDLTDIWLVSHRSRFHPSLDFFYFFFS